ncbi:VPS9 domain-containing protein 1-like isoform X1 [Montipora foliosa]|uniref:VPS9 domain-containing protein 1-like isoform X1 n=2 Tax=Montipora foliosa TaxID=591990 RepID=UPI0035F1E7DC
MTEGVGACMPIALRSVGDAIRLDSENKTKEAYCQYLSCVIYISQVLKDDAWDKDLGQVFNNDTAKLFRLLQQCQERAFTIISSLGDNMSSFQVPNVHSGQGVQQTHVDSNTTNLSQFSQSSLAPQSAGSHKLSEQSVTVITPSTDEHLQLPSPPGSPKPHHRRTGSYDPLERAYQENKQLITAYRARMQNANKGRRNQDVISKNLSLMRRMSENLKIAKAREEAIKKKLLERQQRLQEETNRRFGPAVLSSKEEIEQRVLYTKILEFEQETVWPKNLRGRLTLMPTDAKLIKEIISKIFSSSDHPLTQFLLQYQYHVYRKLAPLVKDVGSPDATRKSQASGIDNDTVPTETNLDNEQSTEEINSLRDNEEDIGNDLETRIEDTKKSAPVESFQEGLVNETSEFAEGKNDGVGDNRNGDLCKAFARDEENVASTHPDENRDSSMDLEKLKNLLAENAPDSSPTEDMMPEGKSQTELKSSCFDGMDESEKLEIYFQELEDDMFGWESNGEESCETENENVYVAGSNVVVNEESFEGDMEDNGLQMGEVRSENHSMDVVPEGASSIQSDSSVGRGKNWFKWSDGEDKESSNEEVKPFMEKDNEMADVADQDKGVTDGNNAIEESPAIVNFEQESTGDGTNQERESEHDKEDKGLKTRETEAKPNVYSKEEISPAISEEPHKERGGQNDVKEQGESHMSKLPVHKESSVDNKQEHGAVSTSDEVRNQLKDVLLDVRFFLEKLQNLLILAYEPLDTAAGRDLCYSCVEFPFFKPLWPKLLAVLRQVNYEKEIYLADVMSTNIDKGPGEMGVPQRLCMEDQKLLDSTGNKYPYQMAVEELHKVVTLFCPLEKLECLVRTSRCICQCVEDYWENKGKPRHSPETAIGCDDLLPILSFVIIRSGMAQLVSECDAMEEFIPAGYLMGEEGYCLTTLMTALAYLATLKST